MASIEMPPVAVNSGLYYFGPSSFPENTVIIDSADTSSNVIPMILEATKTVSEFQGVLFYWSTMVVICAFSLVLAILDIAGVIDFVHPYLWFTVSGASAILGYTHFLRLKQLWLNR